jgi:hypothetical protein
MALQRNVGLIDGILRTGISLIMFYLAFFYPDTAQDPVTASILGIIGAINLIVALVGICPVYLLTDINTTQTTRNSSAS